MTPVDAQNPSASVRIGEAARLLEVSPDTIRRWCDAGKLHCTRTLGGQRRIRRADVEALLDEGSAA